MKKIDVETLINILSLLDYFSMPIQENRHYKRVAKLPESGWAHGGRLFNK